MSTKAKKQRIIEDSIESKRGVGEENQVKALKKMPIDSIKALWEQLIKPSVKKTAPEQIFGIEGGRKGSKKDFRESIPYKISEEGEFILGKQEEETEEETHKITETKEHTEYFREIQSGETAPLKKQEQKDQQRCAEIMLELKRLAKTSKVLEREVQTIVMEIPPAKTGKYHSSFLEWLLLTLKKAQERLDEGAAWTRMFSSKKSQKQYWNMVKKHDTTFMLSGERTVSTQTA